MIAKTLSIYLLAIGVSLLIAALIRLIVVVLARWGAARPQPVPAAATAAGAAGAPADHVAAIAAAVYAAIGPHRIVHIQETRRRAGWIAEGRQAQHGSHGVEHHTRR